MRLIAGMLLGALLTVGFAYLHDTRVPSQTEAGGELSARTLVNWNVAEERWNEFTGNVANLGRDAQRGFDRLAGNL